MKNKNIMLFFKEHVGIEEEKLQNVINNSCFMSYSAKEKVTFSNDDLKKYTYFIINQEGVILFSLNSVEGDPWCIFLSANMHFPILDHKTNPTEAFIDGFVSRKTEILGIKREDVKYLRKHSSKFCDYMEKGTKNLLCNIVSRSVNSQALRMDQRVLTVILILLERYGYDLPTGERVVHLRQIDLAAISGTTIQNIARILHKLRKMKVIETKWKSIIVKREYYDKHRVLID